MVDVSEEEQNRAMIVGSGITSAEIVQNRTVHGLVLENWLEINYIASIPPRASIVALFWISSKMTLDSAVFLLLVSSVPMAYEQSPAL